MMQFLYDRPPTRACGRAPRPLNPWLYLAAAVLLAANALVATTEAQNGFGSPDVNGDGTVDATDLAEVRASFGKRTGETGFSARADVNHDGLVNIADLSYVSRYVGQSRPSIAAAVDPAPNAAGWNNLDVVVTFTCGAGATSCSPPVPVSSESAGQVVAGTASNIVGTSTATITVRLDKTPPAFAFVSPADGAVVTAPSVSVNGAISDALSGPAVVSCNGSPASLNGPTVSCVVPVSPGSNTIAVTARDVAGNVSTTSRTVVYKPTETPPAPTVTITSPSSLSYFNISPTTVTGTVSDPAATVTVNSIQTAVVNGQFSMALPLAEGPNIITATATTPAGVGTASIEVTLDTTPPHVTITSPPDGFVTSEASLSVAGIINDIVVGTVNDQEAKVKVNGTTARVANRTFLATNVPLELGSNVIQAIGADRVGNQVTTQILVVRQAVTGQARIQLVSGNNQAGAIGTALPSPLVVALFDAAAAPAAGKQVIFKVTQDDGLLSAGGTPAPTVIATTDAAGRAEVQWTLGMRAGAGGNAVEAYSVGSDGTAIFTASGTQGPAGKIVVDTGNDQVGATGQALPKPFIAVVVDDGNNRLKDVPVTFTVQEGGGSFNGQPTYTVNSDSDGRVAATLTLGMQEGNANNVIGASFPSNAGFPAAFTASGRAPGDPAKTVISGVILDNSNQPVPGVTIRAVGTNELHSSALAVQAATAVKTDAKGQFSVPQAPIGLVKLMVDGSTADLPGTYPSLEYDMITVAGQNNTVGQPIYILPLNTSNQLCVTQTTGGGTLTIPEAPGFSLTFGPGQVTFPGGAKTGCINVTTVHGDKVPMVPGFGQQPRFIVTIQPSGAVFNPPAPITLPNVDGLKPREVTEMYSYDHDISSFVAIGTGVVSDDGQVIRSSQGVGVLKAGWHCGGNPSPPGTAAQCPVCFFCPGSLGPCMPQGNGTACGNGGTCQYGQGCVGGSACPPGSILNAFGQCCQGSACQPSNCPPGQHPNLLTGLCDNDGPCAPGWTLNAQGRCCLNGVCRPPSCPAGTIFNPSTGGCSAYVERCTPGSSGQFCNAGGGSAAPGVCNASGGCDGDNPDQCGASSGCSACTTTASGQECTACSNGRPPINGQCNQPVALTLLVNGTADTADDITLLSPPQPLPITVSMTGGDGLQQIHFSVSPAGKAILDVTTLNLTVGQSATVRATPAGGPSSFPLDTTIEARDSSGTLVATANFTIVAVTLPGHITANDPIAQLPDRIPPRVATPVYVIVTPDLTSGHQSISLAPFNGGDTNHGDFTIGATRIQATGFVQLTGTTQTAANAQAPGSYAGQLKLNVLVHGALAAQSAGFSVAAWPNGLVMTGLGNCHPSNLIVCDGAFGIAMIVDATSDSGNSFDLGAIGTLEQIQVTFSEGILRDLVPHTQPDYLPIFPGVTDTNGIPASTLCANVAGEYRADQFHIFRDGRTGVAGIPMPKSGFKIQLLVLPGPNGGPAYIDVTKTGAALALTGAGYTIPATGLGGTETPPEIACRPR